MNAIVACGSEPLALRGGKPVRSHPLPPWPCVGEEEISAAVTVLRSGKINYWTGNEGRLFEQEYAASLGRKYAVAVANGTVALELALYALGIGPGDEVIVPSRTFIASASCAAMRGATPVCADLDPASQTLTAETIEAALSPRTKAVIAVHLAGWCCDMDPILSLCRRQGVAVIEDCAQAHGATYKGRPAGAMGDVAAFSFCQDKIISTGGEGGLLVTDDESLYQRAWSFKDHGKNYHKSQIHRPSTAFAWVHEKFGTNWRLTEMQSAIGRVLLRKLDEQVAIRRRNAAVLTRRLARIPALRVTPPPETIGHAYYKYYFFIRPEMLLDGWDRDRIIAAICAEGIPCFSGSCGEIYRERAFDEARRPAAPLAVARELSETSLMLLVHPTLSEADMLDACQAVEKVMSTISEPSRNLELKLLQTSQISTPLKPMISVVMAAFNERDSIEQCVQSVLAQDTKDFELEVLVIDGNSTDGTTELVSHIAAADGRVRLLHNPDRKTPVAFNLGIRAARGEYVCILGAHAVYPPDYISVCLQELQRHGVVGCSGRVLTIPANDTLQANLTAWTLASRFASSPTSARTRIEGFVDTIPFPVFRKEPLLKIGGYNEALHRNQDNDMNQRLRAQGYHLYLTSRTHALYRARPTLAALVKYAFRNGWWNCISMGHNPASMSLRHFVPSLFVITLLALIGMGVLFQFVYVYRPLAYGAIVTVLLVLAAHLTLGIAAASATAVRTKVLAPLLLPPVFLAFHVAYGFGTLVGMTTNIKAARSQAPQTPRPEAEVQQVRSRS